MLTSRVELSSMIISQQQYKGALTTGAITNRQPMYYPIVGTTTAGNKVISSVTSIFGVPVSDYGYVFAIYPGSSILGDYVDNDPSAAQPLEIGQRGSTITALNPVTGQITMSTNALATSPGPVTFQVGNLYTVYSSMIALVFKDHAPNNQNVAVGGPAFIERDIPIAVAVGPTGLIDRCFHMDPTLLCGSEGGVADTSGICGTTMYNRATYNIQTGQNSGFKCTSATLTYGPAADCVVAGACEANYLITGITSTGSPICQCVLSCPM